MKKILLLSDSHSYIDEHILKHAEMVDEIWHAGDIGSLEVTDALSKIRPVKAVYGNIDDATIRSIFPKNLFFKCENVGILMTHIAGNPPHYNKLVLEQIKRYKPQIFVCGHSHLLKVMYDKTNQLLFMNPGAIGKYGIHTVRTMLRFEINNDKINNLEVIEIQR
ncbi:MAG: metallophosphoesterase family protein [Bacteroidota bacterium]|nr:metallophosphoesterase family protein [Bacteroidota bacterium]